MKTGSISEFQRQVLDIVQKIPKGKVATYGQIAKILGNTRAFRAVGQALRRNPAPILVPCHRVIKSCGRVGGYNKGQGKKIELLRREGVRFDSEGKVSLRDCKWQSKNHNYLK